MPLLSKDSNVVQNVFFLYDVTGFTQIRHSTPVATSCRRVSREQGRFSSFFVYCSCRRVKRLATGDLRLASKKSFKNLT